MATWINGVKKINTRTCGAVTHDSLLLASINTAEVAHCCVENQLKRTQHTLNTTAFPLVGNLESKY